MHKKCKEILEHLEKDKKIKISSYKFPEKEELKLRLKDLLEEKVDEKYYLSDEKIKRISNWESHQKPFEKVQGRNSIVPTLTARGAGEEHSGMIIYSDKLEKTTNLQNKLLSRDYKEPKCVQVGSLMGEKWDKMHDVSKRVYSVEGISPTIHTCNGGNTEPKVMDKIKKIELPQKVKVRKYPANTEKLKEVLRSHKSYTNKEIALKLNQPLTLVEHWFRKDDSFSIPNANIWFELKALLKIDTNEFDESITQFEEKEGAYEKSNRIYLDSGISPTLTSCSSDQPKIQESFVSKHYNNFIKENGYLPKFFNPYHETEIKDIAPTQTTNCGSYGSSASVCIGENECKINEFPSIIQKQGDRGTDKYSTNSENSYTISANPMSDRNQLLVEKPKATESDSNFMLGPMQNHASINRDGITPTLTSAMGESGGHVPMHNYDFRIRKLTPKECWRLMDFDDEDFEKASKINSNTQLYKQAGNSIVVNVLAKIISNLGI